MALTVHRAQSVYEALGEGPWAAEQVDILIELKTRRIRVKALGGR